MKGNDSQQLDEQKERQRKATSLSSASASTTKPAPIKSALQSVNQELESANAHLNKYLAEHQEQAMRTPTVDERLRQLQQTVKDLTEKCEHLNVIQEKEESEEKRVFDELLADMDACNAAVLKCNAEFDKQFSGSKPTANAALASSLVGEQQQFERDHLLPVKNDLDKLSKQYDACLANSTHMEQERLTTLEVKYDKLCASFAKLEQRVHDRSKGKKPPRQTYSILPIFKFILFFSRLKLVETKKFFILLKKISHK